MSKHSANFGVGRLTQLPNHRDVLRLHTRCSPKTSCVRGFWVCPTLSTTMAMWTCDYKGCGRSAVRTLGDCVLCNKHLCSKHLERHLHTCPSWEVSFAPWLTHALTNLLTLRMPTPTILPPEKQRNKSSQNWWPRSILRLLQRELLIYDKVCPVLFLHSVMIEQHEAQW